MVNEKITIPQMIAYLQRTSDEWSQLMAKGEGEEWMIDATAVEQAIIKTLNAVYHSAEGAPLLPKWAIDGTPIQLSNFNEDAIGNNIKVKVKLLHEIDVLKERLQGSQNPDGNYATLLHEKQEELKWTNETLRDLKSQHKLHLQHRLATLDREIEQSFDAFSIDELNGIRREIVRKIEMIDAELKTL